MRAHVSATGHLTKEQLKLVVEWKSPRSAGRVDRNEEAYVREISEFAFRTGSDRARIESLTLLDGVLWPTASVILHLFHSESFPILDFRALWSVSTEVPVQYTYTFWQEYTVFCRKLASQHRVSMRELDRALWQYSKEHQWPSAA
jgi:hypothetical protein